MDRRAVLKYSLLLASASSVAGCSGLSGSRAEQPEDIHFHMGLFAVTPISTPLVVGGLAEDETIDGEARLFVARPDEEVFTDEVENESPYMRRHVQDTRYKNRFKVLVQRRFAEPFLLQMLVPHRFDWVSFSRLRAPLEAQPVSDPAPALETAEDTIATTLLIFTYGETPPESIVLPINGPNGSSLGELNTEQLKR